ncbi:hypothetical protein [Actinomadura litoris]|uniref:hypothetical protein n=1 Tax=Actinomadura litoris TaxID=2678616 RepID=UPI001FA7A976|nr:hypothetical protein [Actinomadura litoris]
MHTFDAATAARITHLLDQLNAAFDTATGMTSLFRMMQTCIETGPDCTETARSLTASLRETAALVDELRRIASPPTASCGCLPTARPVRATGVATGHEDDCVRGAPRTYVWQYAGALAKGTLSDYARAWELARHSGSLQKLSKELHTWDETFRPNVELLGIRSRGRLRYRLTVEGESVSVLLEGRA